MMTSTDLLNAHNDYADAYDAWETAYPFDLLTAMDRPNPPEQSIAAQAGEMIAKRGLTQALAVALTHAMDGSNVSDQQRAVYLELTIAAADDGE
jgi:hypothetical protein